MKVQVLTTDICRVYLANKMTNFLPWNEKKKKQQLEPGMSELRTSL